MILGQKEEDQVVLARTGFRSLDFNIMIDLQRKGKT